jgi:hypothetical protein
MIDKLIDKNVWIFTYSESTQLNPVGLVKKSFLGDDWLAIYPYEDKNYAYLNKWPISTPFPAHIRRDDIRAFIELTQFTNNAY